MVCSPDKESVCALDSVCCAHTHPYNRQTNVILIAYPLYLIPDSSRVSVIRGQVISREGNGLIGIRVSVATDTQFGFTLTRGDGWYECIIPVPFPLISTVLKTLSKL